MYVEDKTCHKADKSYARLIRIEHRIVHPFVSVLLPGFLLSEILH